jgi:hypothetical protein
VQNSSKLKAFGELSLRPVAYLTGCKPRLFHHFRDHLAESGVSVGGNLLAERNRFRDRGFVFRIPQLDPTALGVAVTGSFSKTDDSERRKATAPCSSTI